MLFDKNINFFEGYKTSNQSDFEYLNHSSRAEAALIRVLLESWFSYYPDSNKTEFINKFRFDKHHNSCFTELLIHEIFRINGFNLTVEPTLSHTTKTPDFEAKKEGEKIYIEIKQIDGLSHQEKGEDKLKNEIYDLISQIETTDFFINVISLKLKSAVSLKKLKAAFCDWLNAQNYEEVLKLGKSEQFDFEENGNKIKLDLLPKKSFRGRKGVRSLGVHSIRAAFIEETDNFLSAIKKKALKYGKLNAPFVIVINNLHWLGDLEDSADAIFANIFKKNQNTRVSAVIIALRATPWNLANKPIMLIKNPFAEFPIKIFPQIPEYEYETKTINFISFGKLFDLEDGWPEV